MQDVQHGCLTSPKLCVALRAKGSNITQTVTQITFILTIIINVAIDFLHSDMPLLVVVLLFDVNILVLLTHTLTVKGCDACCD